MTYPSFAKCPEFQPHESRDNFNILWAIPLKTILQCSLKPLCFKVTRYLLRVNKNLVERKDGMSWKRLEGAGGDTNFHFDISPTPKVKKKLFRLQNISLLFYILKIVKVLRHVFPSRETFNKEFEND